MSYVGVNIGALTVKVAALRGDARSATVLAHQGLPLEILDEVLAGQEYADAEYFGVSGQLGHISEVAAVQRALREVDGTFDAVVSLGGESFLVYLLMDGRITNVVSHNKCAAGSGEFFMQQIGRMGLGMEEAIQPSPASPSLWRTGAGNPRPAPTGSSRGTAGLGSGCGIDNHRL